MHSYEVPEYRLMNEDDKEPICWCCLPIVNFFKWCLCWRKE